MITGSGLALAWKLGLVIAIGVVIWIWTVPPAFQATWNYRLSSHSKRSHLLYQRVLKTILYLENEAKQNKFYKPKMGLPIAEPVRGANNIFFIETSCLVNFKTKSLTARQTCSIESAARTNPVSHIYLLHSCPLYYKSSRTALGDLYEYPNIKFWPVTMKRLISGTPLENWNYEKAFNSSSWPLEHSSDVARFLVLYKYGGTYLDLDIITTRSLEFLEPNFVCEESDHLVGSSVMRLDYQNTGHLLADLCVLGIAADFRGNIWTYNGPQLITRSLKVICGLDEVELMSPELCMGVVIHPREFFFPIPYQRWQDLFNESHSHNTMWKIRNSFGVHMWNKLSRKAPLNVGSSQPYILLAQEFCPRIYESSSHEF